MYYGTSLFNNIFWVQINSLCLVFVVPALNWERSCNLHVKWIRRSSGFSGAPGFSQWSIKKNPIYTKKKVISWLATLYLPLCSPRPSIIDDIYVWINAFLVLISPVSLACVCTAVTLFISVCYCEISCDNTKGSIMASGVWNTPRERNWIGRYFLPLPPHCGANLELGEFSKEVLFSRGKKWKQVLFLLGSGNFLSWSNLIF